MEDDLQLTSCFKDKVTQIVNFLDEMDPNWGIVGVGHCGFEHNQGLTFIEDFYERIILHFGSEYYPYSFISPVSGFLCTHCYMLRNTTAAKTMFSALNSPRSDSEGRVLPLADNGWQNSARGFHPLMDAYVYVPNDIAYQNRESHSSTIRSTELPVAPAMKATGSIRARLF